METTKKVCLRRSFARWVGRRVLDTGECFTGIYKGFAGQGKGWVLYDDERRAIRIDMERLKKIYVTGTRCAKSLPEELR